VATVVTAEELREIRMRSEKQALSSPELFHACIRQNLPSGLDSFCSKFSISISILQLKLLFGGKCMIYETILSF
jgi:hypothetical protein